MNVNGAHRTMSSSTCTVFHRPGVRDACRVRGYYRGRRRACVVSKRLAMATYNILYSGDMSTYSIAIRGPDFLLENQPLDVRGMEWTY
ncbi:uncharacterized protein STEHIDRAFT_118562 [Stereum hirsutum FP-91666 SS1]|uniref:uncharacterized protein n=1 Tax=Stereum hirsutum (strain FP-91666) TaxID=721885 RepID=UPI000440BD30|nr:uncharacterized protein STEHIDRAFT_118562 [Stereum hirsutum FP-91666 SS1]EIM91539.1 hypothetical protein STEHIDRAFT_118562 [Stereum hirsutum FP-91666 SS1]